MIDTFLAAGTLEAVDYTILLPDVETCVGRIQNRVGHGFGDLSAARKMHSEFAGANVAASHVITDNCAPAGEVAQEILARRTDGRLTYQIGSS